MRLFFSYLKMNIRSILTFIVVCCVFICVAVLYNVSTEPVLYAAALCTAFGTAVLVFGFMRFRHKHETLRSLEKSIVLSLDELPEPDNIIESDFGALLRELYSSKRRIQSEMDETVSDMTDYYTLWAHQIKTPIAAARLLLQSEDSINPELGEQLFRIEQYVEMVLTYLRTDSETTDYVIKLCSLDSIVKGAVKKYAKSFIRKKLSLEFIPSGRSVITDEKWLSFVIEQLLSNALKYTSSGKISIYLNESGDLVIEDTGIGIAPEDLPRVFEKGYTGYNGRADKKSTGIGLYLCKRILDRLSHSIAIYSEVSVGTRVTLTFDNHSYIYE